MVSNLVKKVLGSALASTLLFGNPENAYAPDLHKEMKEERMEYLDQYYEKRNERDSVLRECDKYLGKESLEDWVQGKIDKLNPYEIIDVNYVLSIMKQESRFKPYLKSPAGARGLMQVMPHTWEGTEGEGFDRDAYNPDKNLEVGIKVLDWMANYCERKYPHWDEIDEKEKRRLTSAAYNGGSLNLKKRNFDVSKMYGETRDYVDSTEVYYEEFEKLSPLDFEEFKEKRFLENYGKGSGASKIYASN
jgi:membrane-bound lytic murein transglycosylase MltF